MGSFGMSSIGTEAESAKNEIETVIYEKINVISTKRVSVCVCVRVCVRVCRPRVYSSSESPSL